MYVYIYIYIYTHTYIYAVICIHEKTLPSKNTGNLRKIMGPCPKKCLKQMEVSGKIMENPWTFYGDFQEQTVSLPEGSASTTWKSCIWGVNQQNHGKTTGKPYSGSVMHPVNRKMWPFCEHLLLRLGVALPGQAGSIAEGLEDGEFQKEGIVLRKMWDLMGFNGDYNGSVMVFNWGLVGLNRKYWDLIESNEDFMGFIVIIWGYMRLLWALMIVMMHYGF